jgi:hypothetical protein
VGQKIGPQMANVCIAIALKLTVTLRLTGGRRDSLITIYIYISVYKIALWQNFILKTMKSFLRSSFHLSMNYLELKLGYNALSNEQNVISR